MLQRWGRPCPLGADTGRVQLRNATPLGGEVAQAKPPEPLYHRWCCVTELNSPRDKVAQMKQDEAQRRDGCETFRTVMENEVRKGNLTAADLAAGMKDRGCVGNN